MVDMVNESGEVIGKDVDGRTVRVGDVLTNTTQNYSVRVTGLNPKGIKPGSFSGDAVCDPENVWCGRGYGTEQFWRLSPAPAAEESETVRGWRKRETDGLWPFRAILSGDLLYDIERDARSVDTFRESPQSFTARGRPLTLREVVDLLDPVEAESAPDEDEYLDANNHPLGLGDRVRYKRGDAVFTVVARLLGCPRVRMRGDLGSLIEDYTSNLVLDEPQQPEPPSAEVLTDEDMCQPCGTVLPKEQITYSYDGVPYCAICYQHTYPGGTCADCHHIGPSVRVGWDYTERALCVYCGHRVADTVAAMAGAHSYEDWSKPSVVAAVVAGEYSDSDRCGARVDWEFP